jgi:prolyl-tRNA synthetase
MSQLFGRTLRETPSGADTEGHALLLRAGFLRRIGAGIYSLLPLGYRIQRKIEAIIREEIDRIGGQELLMPVVNPAELWEDTGRYWEIGDELTRFDDRVGRHMVLAMTHEEALTALTATEIRSYRDLPKTVYHIQTKWRDDPRPRAGLIRVREFTMKDSYSLAGDWETLDRQYKDHYEAYVRIFGRCGLSVLAVQSDVGMMGGKEAHEFMYITPIGEDTLILCDSCGYNANRQVARFRKPIPEEAGGDENAEATGEHAGGSSEAENGSPEEVETPNATTIEALKSFLGVPAHRLGKAYFAIATVSGDEGDHNRFVLGIVRGDLDVNETKLANAAGAKELRPATDDEIRAAGAVPGYGGPLGVKESVQVIVDDSIPELGPFVTGANREGYHIRGIRYGRDFRAAVVTDIAAADDGLLCPECGQPLRAVRGVEVGNIFKLGTRYSEAVGATFLDSEGTQKPVIMGSYGIGVGRLIACVAEAFRDDAGLALPVSVAPYAVHLVDLTTDGEFAGTLYDSLQNAGIDVLLDDRNERPGVKFNDADLIGCPLRITVGQRGLDKGIVELKARADGATDELPVDGAVERIVERVRGLYAELPVN